jgi:hypothetical protein
VSISWLDVPLPKRSDISATVLLVTLFEERYATIRV